jgi:transcriptional regulator with XRE-family HTH domain
MGDCRGFQQERGQMSKEPTDARSRFAHRLRAIRIPRGFKTARSFAKALGIDENRYTRYERAEVEPDLQLLLRICELLKATPNDLLCDTIGSSPALAPYGFSETPGMGFEAPAKASNGDASPKDDERKAIAWQLAEAVALLKAKARNGDVGALTAIEKLRLIGPVFASLEADAFSFLAKLPAELEGIALDGQTEARIGVLSEKLLAAHSVQAS